MKMKVVKEFEVDVSTFDAFVQTRPVHPNLYEHSRKGGRAYAPHCDPAVLHSPGTCPYCDSYPDRQWDRLVQRINFSGEHDPKKAPCPSTHFRSEEIINRWPGNRPEGYGSLSLLSESDPGPPVMCYPEKGKKKNKKECDC